MSAQKRNFRPLAAAKRGNELELLVYSAIGSDLFGEGVTSSAVSTAIKKCGVVDSITVRVNSPGGDSFEGVAVFNILRQQKCPVNVVVEGLAASAAFTIAMAGDTIQVCDGAMMMLHNAWSVAIGDAAELRRTGELLDQVSGTLRDLYSKRSGLSRTEVATLMQAETWLTPDEAVQKGFATSRLGTTPEHAKLSAKIAARFDVAKFCRRKPDDSSKPSDRAFMQWKEDLERRARTITLLEALT